MITDDTPDLDQRMTGGHDRSDESRLRADLYRISRTLDNCVRSNDTLEAKLKATETELGHWKRWHADKEAQIERQAVFTREQRDEVARLTKEVGRLTKIVGFLPLEPQS